MKIYQVGGAVRDRLLGLPVKDRDWLVVGADEQQMLAQGFTRLDGRFPVFLHPESGEEYALVRRERKVGPGYKGFEFEVGPDVTLEQDLARRDLTINAIAEDESGQLIDPYHGQADLEQRFLRHITPAFVEDPLRLLRVARFAARFSHLGFRVAHDTFKLMRQMCQPEELSTLPAERIWLEMKLALGCREPWRFFELLQRCGALATLLPPLHAAWPQSNSHAESGGDDPMQCLKQAVQNGLPPQQCLAVLLVGSLDRDQALSWAESFPLEKPYQQALQDLATHQDLCAGVIRREVDATLTLIKQCRALHDDSRLLQLVGSYRVLQGEAVPDEEAWLQQSLAQLRKISPAPLQAQGVKGPELAKLLEKQQKQQLQQLRQAFSPGAE